MTAPGQRGDFTAQAEAYARARPGYPAEIVDRVVAAAGVRPGDAVADLGAGTGLFTALLAARGLRVTAVEPNAAMRARAPVIAGVDWVDGSFEAAGLPAASQRWVVAAQAFHWADPQRALPELHRVLGARGAFTVLWNDRDVEPRRCCSTRGCSSSGWCRDSTRATGPATGRPSSSRGAGSRQPRASRCATRCR